MWDEISHRELILDQNTGRVMHFFIYNIVEWSRMEDFSEIVGQELITDKRVVTCTIKGLEAVSSCSMFFCVKQTR